MSRINTKIDHVPIIHSKVDDISSNVLVMRSELGTISTQVDSMSSRAQTTNEAIPETLSKLRQIERGVDTLVTRTDNEMSQAFAQIPGHMQELTIGIGQLTAETQRSSSQTRSGMASFILMQSDMFSKLSKIEEALGIEDPCGRNSPGSALSRLVSKPSYTKQVYDDFSELETAWIRPKALIKRDNQDCREEKLKLACTCHSEDHHQSARFRFGQFWLIRDSSTHGHKPGCRLYLLEPTRIQSLGLVTRVLSYGVQLVVSVTTGAGGFSISPNISFRPVVASAKSPVFRLTDLLNHYLIVHVEYKPTTPDKIRFIERCKDGILHLYRQKKAYPYETDICGASFFHRWASLLSYDIPNDVLHVMEICTEHLLQAGLSASFEDFRGL